MAFLKKQHFVINKSSWLLIASFSIVLIIAVAALSFVSQQIQKTQRQINEIVGSNNQKSTLVVQMQQHARERSLALYNMMTTNDPFDYDESYEIYRNSAGVFINARQTLLSMPLTEKEEALISQQGILSSRAVPIQNEIITLIESNKKSEAAALLIKQSIPAQNAVLSVLEKLIQFQNTLNKKTSTQVKNDLKHEKSIVFLSGMAIVFITILIAAYVVKRITKTERQLFIEKELAQITLHSITDGVITVDKNYIIKTINPAASNLTGKSIKKAIGQNILSMYDGEEAKKRDIFNNQISNIESQRTLFDFTLTQDDGTQYEVEHTIAPIIDRNQDILGAVIILRDVTEMRLMEKRLSFQATHDALTSLINRREFEIRLNQLIRNAQSENESHSVCFLDLDKFKIINDTSGHAAGDEFLKQISKIIQQSLRQNDVLSRLGGDEFGIILHSCSIPKAKLICNGIIKTIRETRFNWDNNSFESGASIGIAPITQLTTSISDVMSSVDAACYEAKDKGRNRIQVFEPNDADFVKHQNETSWIQKIKSAIDHNEFELFFQEIISLNPTNSTPKTIEILIRLNLKGNIIAPDSFIPTAERYNMMPIIDEWVIENTFKFLNEYKDITGDEVRVAINLSGQSLSEDNVLNLITKRLRKSKDVKKENVCFEITETAAIANLTRAVEFISTVKEMGCRFSLDDFGSGLSSFSYLKNMPIDNLKIDGIFIRDIMTDPINRAFVESIHNIGKMMGIKTTAEYVENEAILDCITEIGIDYAQGYHISKPAPVKTLLNPKKTS